MGDNEFKYEELRRRGSVLKVENELQPNRAAYEPRQVSGLGGWLVLIQIGLYLTLLLAVVQIADYSLMYLTDESWRILADPASEFYEPLWVPLVIFESVYNILFFLFTIFVLIQFYRKKTSVPVLLIIFYASSLTIGIVDYVWLQQLNISQYLDDSSIIRDISRSAVTCLIWIPYLRRSKRVRNTFIY